MNLAHQFAEAITRLREARGLTKGEFADRVGSAQGVTGPWEKGRVIPDAASLVLIARAFEISLSEFFIEAGVDTPTAATGGATALSSHMLQIILPTEVSETMQDEWNAVAHQLIKVLWHLPKDDAVREVALLALKAGAEKADARETPKPRPKRRKLLA